MCRDLHHVASGFQKVERASKNHCSAAVDHPEAVRIAGRAELKQKRPVTTPKDRAASRSPRSLYLEEDDMLYTSPLSRLRRLPLLMMRLNEFSGPEDAICSLAVPAAPTVSRTVERGVGESPRFPQCRAFCKRSAVAFDKLLPYSKESGHSIRLGRSIRLVKVLVWDKLGEERSTER